MAGPAKSTRFVVAWRLCVLAAVAASAAALWFGYEQSASYIGCASTSTTRGLARLTLMSAGVSLVFAVAAGVVLVRHPATTARWAVTTVVFAFAVLFSIIAVVEGSACVGCTGGAA